MRLVWTDEEFADEFAKTIVEKYDRGEHISPDDVLRRIKEKPEYDEVVELSEKLGILPPDSLQDRLSKRTPPRYPAATQYADAARQRMAAAVNAFVSEVTAFWEQKADPDFEWLTAENDKRRDLHAALHCDVGLGKTHITQREVQAFIKSAKRKEIPHRVLWLVPHHALSRETLAGFEYADVSVAVWRGREADDPNNVRTDGSFAPMCLDNSAIRDAQVAGADPDQTVCGSLAGQHCPFLATCSYKKQRDVCQNADVVIAVHNVLFMPLVKSVMKNIGLVVVDEGFWSKGVHADRDINLLSLANDVMLSPVLDSSGNCNNPDTGWLEGMCVKLQKAALAVAAGDFLGGDLAGISAEDAQRAAKMEFKRRLEPHMWPGMAPID